MNRIFIGLSVICLVILNGCSCNKEDCNCNSKPFKLRDRHELVQIGLLDERGFIKDDMLPFYPSEDIMACFDHKLEYNSFEKHKNIFGKFNKPCPVCGKEAKNLLWIYFSSPASTWANLCGRSGPMSICCKCRIPVEFELDVLN